MKNYDKNYDTAADRLKVFYDKYPEHRIVTRLLNHIATSEGKYQVDFLASIINSLTISSLSHFLFILSLKLLVNYLFFYHLYSINGFLLISNC